jgi:hypothetical protein
MALRTGCQGDSLLIHRRIRIDLCLDPMNAMARRAGGRVASPSRCKNPMNTFDELFRNLGMAYPAGLRDVRPEDRGLGVNQGSQVVTSVTTRAGHFSCLLMDTSFELFSRRQSCA